MFDVQADQGSDPALAGILRDLGDTMISMDGEQIKNINRKIRNYSDQNKVLIMPNVSRMELSKDGARFRGLLLRGH
jgi:hypothetical protein